MHFDISVVRDIMICTHFLIRREHNMNERIRLLRLEKRLKQKDVANDIGISVNHLGYIEKGIRNPSDGLLVKISQYYSVNSEWIKTGEGEKYTNIDKQFEQKKEQIKELAVNTINLAKESDPFKTALINTISKMTPYQLSSFKHALYELNMEMASQGEIDVLPLMGSTFGEDTVNQGDDV